MIVDSTDNTSGLVTRPTTGEKHKLIDKCRVTLTNGKEAKTKKNMKGVLKKRK